MRFSEVAQRTSRVTRVRGVRRQRAAVVVDVIHHPATQAARLAGRSSSHVQLTSRRFHVALEFQRGQAKLITQHVFHTRRVGLHFRSRDNHSLGRNLRAVRQACSRGDGLRRSVVTFSLRVVAHCRCQVLNLPLVQRVRCLGLGRHVQHRRLSRRNAIDDVDQVFAAAHV